MRNYTLKLDWEHGLCTGRDASGQQYLFGPHGDDPLVFIFSEAGDWLSMEELPASAQGYDDRIETFLTARGITTGSISINLFYLDPYNIGIRDLPAHWEEFLANRDSVPEDEHDSYDQWIANWRAKKEFVLLWGVNDFWLDGRGEITAS
jgi:hypothetical protein